VYRAKRPIGVALGIALLVSLALGGSALAQGMEGAKLQLTPSRGSGVTGTAKIANVEGGVRVELNMRGLPEAGVEHINHFHQGGTCTNDRAGNPAPATIPLKTIVANDDGTGTAVTTLKDVTVEKLFDPNKERYLAFHSKVIKEPVPPVISCADVIEAAGSGAVSTQLPESGGPQPVILLSAGAALVSGAVAGVLVLWRRFA
jgi:hypothetical protein